MNAPVPSRPAASLSPLRATLAGLVAARPLGITARTALFAWLIAIVTLLLFVFAILPQQEDTFVETLRSKALGVTVSLREVASGAVVNEDYSSVVDHCIEMLRGDPAIDYIVLTRNDGFSLLHDRSGWRSEHLSIAWRPERRTATGSIRTVPLFNRRAYAFSQPFSYSGIEWGWIHVGLSLDSYDRNLHSLYRRTALLIVICVAFGLLASIGYATFLVRPIVALQQVVQRVAHGDLSARAHPGRSDELGRLADAFNTMAEALLRRDRRLQEANETLEQRVRERTAELQAQVEARERANRELADAQRRLIQLSREAGMAEVATGVLHNVGNVLNSVNVSATLVQDQLGNSHLADLLQAVVLLRAHADDLPGFIAHHPQGRHLPGFIVEISSRLAAEHTAWREELAGLAKNIGHIKEIVGMQQSYARVAGVIERLSPRELVEDAIRVNEAAFQRHRIALLTEFAPAPTVAVDKHKVLQILINLLSNAKHAVSQLPAASRCVGISVRALPGDRVQITVTDNGVGIPRENLARIFSHGFTTRQDGHGFGLHTGALAAQALGGSLTAHSDGPGAGARFVLELPAEPDSSST